MYGMEILKQIPVYMENVIPIILLFSWAILSISITEIIPEKKLKPIYNKYMSVIVFILIILGINMIVNDTTDEIDYYKYEISASDSIKMNDFLEKYEILEIKGDGVYVVKEKLFK